MTQTKQKTWYLKLVSVIMAVMLWLFVTNESVIFSKKDVTGVKLNIVNLGSHLTANYPDQIGVSIVGTPRQAKDIYAYIDVKGKGAGTYDLPVAIRPMPGTRVSSIDPASVKVELSEVQEYIFPVTYQIAQEPPAGYELNGVEIAPGKCVVRGGQRAVKNIVALEADLDLSAITDTSSLKVAVTPVDTKGKPVAQVTVTPSTVQAYVVVGLKRTLSQATVNPSLTGTPAQGFSLAGVEVEPRVVTVMSQQELPKDTVVSTQPIDLTDKNSSFQQEVALVPPEGATVVPEKVTVIVSIGGAVQSP
jgi:YbbR domain-containing protein